MEPPCFDLPICFLGWSCLRVQPMVVYPPQLVFAYGQLQTRAGSIGSEKHWVHSCLVHTRWDLVETLGPG